MGRFFLTAPLALIAFLADANHGICAEAALRPSPTGEPPVPYQSEPVNAVVQVPSPTLPTMQRVPPSPAATEWYGYQLMLNDAASIALYAGAITRGWGYAATAGGLAVFFGPSVIHGLHKRGGLAVVSPLMRVGFTLVGGAIGMAAESCSPNEWLCGLTGAAVGGGIGLVTAMIVDWSLAWTPEPTAAESDVSQPFAKSHNARISFTSAGMAPIPNGGASLVLGGRF